MLSWCWWLWLDLDWSQSWCACGTRMRRGWLAVVVGAAGVVGMGVARSEAMNSDRVHALGLDAGHPSEIVYSLMISEGANNPIKCCVFCSYTVSF